MVMKYNINTISKITTKEYEEKVLKKVLPNILVKKGEIIT
jgi:hypothetical protein